MFFKRKEKDNRKKYELKLGLEFGERVYISSAVLDEIMQITYGFDVEILQSTSTYYDMTVIFKCEYVEIMMLINKLRDRFPGIKVIYFKTI